MLTVEQLKEQKKECYRLISEMESIQYRLNEKASAFAEASNTTELQICVCPADLYEHIACVGGVLDQLREDVAQQVIEAIEERKESVAQMQEEVSRLTEMMGTDHEQS